MPTFPPLCESAAVEPSFAAAQTEHAAKQLLLAASFINAPLLQNANAQEDDWCTVCHKTKKLLFIW